MDAIQPVEKQYTIKDAVKNQKCPFRKRIETHVNNSLTEEFMMPCDPYCLALIYHRDEKNPNKFHVGCLRMSHTTDTTPMCITMDGEDL
jgi:hypothetical protein